MSGTGRPEAWQIGWQAGALLALPALNLPLVWRYLGGAAAVAYLAGYGGLVCLCRCRGLSPAVIRLAAVISIAASLVAQFVALHLLAPAYDGRVDRDEALIRWLSALARGEHPYRSTTDLGNPISVLPFMPFVALPAAALGNVGYLEIGAYVALVVLLWHFYRAAPRLQLFSVAVLSSAPLVFFEVIARSDLIVNMALLLTASLLISRQGGAPRQPAAIPSRWLGILLGCVAATRLALLPVLAVPGVYALRRLRPSVSARVAVAASLTAGALVLPFYFWDPQVFVGFAPLGVNSAKLGQDNLGRVAWLAFAGLSIVTCGLLARRARDLVRWLLVPAAVVVISTWSSFFVDLGYLQLLFVPLLFCLRPDEPPAGVRQ